MPASATGQGETEDPEIRIPQPHPRDHQGTPPLMSIPTPALDARSLLTPDDFTGVVATVLDNNPGMPEDTAERIVADALAFVATAGPTEGCRKGGCGTAG